jgi:hypothetical protein
MSIAQITFSAISFKVDTLGNPTQSQLRAADLVAEINLTPTRDKEHVIVSIADDFQLLSAESENDKLIGAFKKRIIKDDIIIKDYAFHTVLRNNGLYSLIHCGIRDAQTQFAQGRPKGFVIL